MEYGLIGQKLGHSFSKLIHTELCGYDYQLVELSPEQVGDFMTERGFLAINVTIPYKQTVMPYLDYIDESAKRIGAVNTVVNKNGRLYGYNTDFSGMKLLIEKNGIDIAGKRVAILGSGGTSKTAYAVATAMGAGEVVRVSRSESDGSISYDTLYERGTDVIINTTPCGMYPNLGVTAVDIDRLELTAIVDAVYNPLRSELVMRGLEKGIPSVGGLYMLVAQAAVAAEYFTGKSIPRSETDRVYKKLYGQKQNIVLVGMPGCGKSTVGERLEKHLSRPFFDSDSEIVKKAGMQIPDIFNKYGESGFRRIESEVIAELAAQSGSVIATGGGAVLDPKNVRFLKQNGVIVFIDRDVDNIEATPSRPLSNDREKLMRLYNERMPVYRACSDITVSSDCTVEQTLTQILKELGFEG